MKFKVDENLPVEVGGLLREAGFDASTLFDEGIAGSNDQTLANYCRQEERVLITLDGDFADIRNYPPREHPGLMVIRLVRQSKGRLIKVVSDMLPLLQTEELAARLWIVEDGGIRIRD